MIKTTESDIGRKLYPVDNSWLFNITDDTDNILYKDLLAASYYGEAKQVVICSEPYLRNVEHRFKILSHEFVNVFYNEKLYAVLNNFTEEPHPWTGA